LIEVQFAARINRSSYAWNASGIHANGALSAAEIKSGSLQSLIEGALPSLPPDDLSQGPSNALNCTQRARMHGRIGNHASTLAKLTLAANPNRD
jgi:hypothetical protein